MKTAVLAIAAIASLAGPAAAELLPPKGPGPAQPYREERFRSNCDPQQALCVLKFSKVPKDKQLRIERIQCISNDYVNTTFYFSRNKSIDINSISGLRMIFAFAAGNQNAGAIPGPFFLAAGEAPVAQAVTTFLHCSMTGFMVPIEDK